MSKQISVLIVDDSQVSRDLLAYILEKDPEIKVVGFAKDGMEAINWLRKNRVDIITMDIFMPLIDGFEVTRRIMNFRPTPIVIISSAFNASNTEQGFKAMEAGAIAILEKPSGLGDIDFHKKEKIIIESIKGIREAQPVQILNRTPIIPAQFVINHPISAVAIGSSLGGPPALSVILSNLDASFPVPIFIVQHIVAGFSEGLVKWLQGYTGLHMHLAKDKQVALPGHCYIAPDNCQMSIKKGNVISLDFQSKEHLKPSVSALFKSMAETYGEECIGVILTGMGKDGAVELLEMFKKGAFTIAQDKNSAVVFGMPKEAIALGGVTKTLPLAQIPIALNYLVQNNSIKQH